jgi:hypothetical protein
MRYFYVITAIMTLFLPQLAKVEWEYSRIQQQDEANKATINSPIAGQAVQGSVVILGNTALDGFLTYEIDFSYSTDPTHTWFLIQESTIPIKDGILAVWDTSTITDGDYSLRLVVNQTSDNQVEITIAGLRVRNYTPKETETSTPILPFVTQTAGIPTQLGTPLVTPAQADTLKSASTPLPTNPAGISTSQVMLTFGIGAAITVGCFTILGAYLSIRAMLHSRK